MGKLHHISSARFSLYWNGEIKANFESIECIVKFGWGQESDPVEFYYNGQKLAGPDTHVGDIVFMDHDGPRTTWVLAKNPRDLKNGITGGLLL